MRDERDDLDAGAVPYPAAPAFDGASPAPLVRAGDAAVAYHESPDPAWT